ncbi:hypothetical protein DAI43_15505 [Achromobacter xylosoxidans]|uniref:right-handed parallel beta-helix repeat-containing protein n=1 Tax=Achromobacter aegrifaciens TaxID=1287736 RepID=UPI000D4AA220|nr:right-handed parallel beta-helix repeat-containing protein [Achromobacter aegrifaciens]MDQ1759032.1 right-handed parallel beta-helix repeat-containing protein [Achromobacter aegrifaciens]PTN50645.1 hypothetical protein DAI43_15505 [Achromobacter xylosoxidans]
MAITISNTVIENCAAGGISAPESADLQIDNVRISGVGGNGITITPSEGAPIEIQRAALAALQNDWQRAQTSQEKEQILTKSSLWDRLKWIMPISTAVATVDRLIQMFRSIP